MNEAEQQRPLELKNFYLCQDRPKSWFIQTKFNYALTFESKISSLSAPCPTTGSPATPGWRWRLQSGFQQSLVNMKHNFLGGEIYFKFGLSIVFIKEQ